MSEELHRNVWLYFKLCSGEHTPAHSAVGAAAFQLAKTTSCFVHAGDLRDYYTFYNMLSESKYAGRVRVSALRDCNKERLLPKSTTSSWDYKGRAVPSRLDESVLNLIALQ